MSVVDRPLTVDDLYALPDDGSKYELLVGTLVSEPLPGFRHGQVTARISALLVAHVDARRLGAVLAGDAGFVLGRRPDTVRGPDVAFVSRERSQRVEDRGRAFEGAPDLAVEVISPSNTAPAIHAKVADYLTAGTRLVWVVDPTPGRETIAVYRSLLTPSVLSPDDELDGEDVVPGFRVRVATLFDS
jgi:Uma2 family endonuclease